MAASKQFAFYAPVKFPGMNRFFLNFQAVLSEYIAFHFFKKENNQSLDAIDEAKQDKTVHSVNMLLSRISSWLAWSFSEAETSYQTDVDQNAEARLILEQWNDICFSDVLKIPAMITERFDILRNQYALNPVDCWQIYALNTKNYNSDIGYQYLAHKIRKHDKVLDHGCSFEEEMIPKLDKIGERFGVPNFRKAIKHICSKHDTEMHYFAMMWADPEKRANFKKACSKFRSKIKKCDFCSIDSNLPEKQ